jgi:SpoVK/Ycf46/Vps4 family AAA+-type ATPase
LNDEVLTGLQAAYAKAPSAELAKIIAFMHLERGEIEALLDYLPALSRPLADVDAAQLVLALLRHGHAEAAEALLAPESPAQAVLRARCLLARHETARAREVYLAAVAALPAARQPDLDRALAADEGERPRLRVVEKNDMASVTDLGRYRAATTTFADVVGLDEIKKQIHKKIIMPFQRPSMFQRFRKKVGGGVLLYGPPGCGKTLLARATAGECNAAFYDIAVSDVLDMYIGESEQKLHAIFAKAREKTPSVLFFDELEALAGKREHSRNSATANTVSQFLLELDGFAQNNEGVLVLASTNVPWSIDTAFLRPGRFDRMFFVPPPDRVARESILRHHMKERPAATDIDYAALAAKTPGYSGADLAHLVESAADEAIDESVAGGRDVDIRHAHFLAALGETRSTTTEWLTTARNYARYANDGGRYDDVLEFMKQHGK